MANDKEKVTEKVEDSAASLTANKGQMTNAELELQADSLGSGEVKRISYFGLIGRRFLRQRSAMIGLGILLVLILIALFGKYLTRTTTLIRTLPPLTKPLMPSIGLVRTERALICMPVSCMALVVR